MALPFFRSCVSIRVHSGIGLEVLSDNITMIVTVFCFNPRSQRHRVGRHSGPLRDGLLPARFNPRSQRHRVGRQKPGSTEDRDFHVSIRVHSGIGLEAQQILGQRSFNPVQVSIRVHSGIGLEGGKKCKALVSPMSFNPRSQRHRVGRSQTTVVTLRGKVSIRVHSGIGLEVRQEIPGEIEIVFQSAFTAA